MGFHFGEAYVMVPLGLRLPTIRVGQAVIPFGLLADYDTHTQIIQTQYARTLGLRLDPGIGFQGDLGKTAYALWVSNGTGPYLMDNNRNKVVTARIAPKFMLGNAEMTWGVSGLAGVSTRAWREWFVNVKGAWQGDYAIPLKDALSVPAPDNKIEAQKADAFGTSPLVAELKRTSPSVPSIRRSVLTLSYGWTSR
jgi:hypothetical protein